MWRTATKITDWVQQSPLDGAPATEDTTAGGLALAGGYDRWICAHEVETGRVL